MAEDCSIGEIHVGVISESCVASLSEVLGNLFVLQRERNYKHVVYDGLSYFIVCTHWIELSDTDANMLYYKAAPSGTVRTTEDGTEVTVWKEVLDV